MKLQCGGSPEECIVGLQEVVRAGAPLVLLNPVFDEMEHLEEFALVLARRLGCELNKLEL